MFFFFEVHFLLCLYHTSWKGFLQDGIPHKFIALFLCKWEKSRNFTVLLLTFSDFHDRVIVLGLNFSPIFCILRTRGHPLLRPSFLRKNPPWLGHGGLQRVEKVFSTRCADFETFRKVSKSCLIERAVGFLPPAHTPRCSVAQVFNEVF